MASVDQPQRSTIIFGFDSAWTDSPGTPGAICAISFDAWGKARFDEPRLVSFAGALAYICTLRAGFDVSLVALDQPTIVPNAAGSRPVDKVAASLVSFIGGGVQPANRSKIGMFSDDAPIWHFLSALDAIEDAVLARSASAGHFLIEVFPALALPAFENDFARRLGAPKYNPQNRRKFRLEDWRAVIRAVQVTADRFGIGDLANWAGGMGALDKPRKADQDRLDAAICALIGLAWRAGPDADSVMLGNLRSGYIVTPVSAATRPRLEQASRRQGLSLS